MALFASPTFFVLTVVAALFTAEGAWTLISGMRARRRHFARLQLQEPGRGSDRSERSLLRGETETKGLDRLFHQLPLRAALSLELRRAGLTWSVSRFLVVSAALGVAAFQLAVLWVPGVGLALPALAFGAAPWAWVRRRSFARTRRFEEQFPDGLDLLIRALRAGHSLSTAVQLVGEELPDPLGREFSQVAHEIRLGQPVKRALDNLVLRVASPDLAFFATAVSVQQETGSNLAEVLEKLSRMIRDRFQLLGKVRALTALGRASANLLALWPAVMVGLLWSVNSAYVAPLWEDPRGHAMIAIAAVMVSVGYWLCRRMAMIKV